MIRTLADRMWSGELATHGMANGSSLVNMFLGLEELEDGVAFIGSFANVAAIQTDDGLVMVDTGSPMLAPKVYKALREWTDARLNTAVFTHGHLDHVFGVEAYEHEAKQAGAPAPRVLAHEAVAARFDRYRETAGYNGIINQRQFRLPAPVWPRRYRYPDETYRVSRSEDIGGLRFELEHAKGETDDTTFVWVPAKKVLCAGDLFIWASPNCGNPQKVQRFPKEWAAALRRMAALGAETMLPGHGLPIFGHARIAEALTQSAELLETLLSQTLAMMNEGATLDDVLHTVEAPAHLIERPFLRPIYDEPEFIVRNIWRLYGGWYDGDPSELKPAPRKDLAGELATLAGGPGKLVDRALALSEAGEHALACHLVEIAFRAAADDVAVARARAQIYGARAENASSVMARGIFEAASERSQAQADKADE